MFTVSCATRLSGPLDPQKPPLAADDDLGFAIPSLLPAITVHILRII